MSFLTSAGTYHIPYQRPEYLNIDRLYTTHLADLRHGKHLSLGFRKVLLVQSLAFSRQDLFESVRHVIRRLLAFIFFLY